MATADEVLAHLGVTFAGVEENQKQVDTAATGVDTTVANIDQVRSTAEELATQSQVMGFEDKVSVTQSAISKCNEAQSQFNAARQSLNGVLTEINGAATTLREAEQIVHSLKALTTLPPPARAGPGEGVPSPTSTNDHPPRSTTLTAHAPPPASSTTGGPRPSHIPDRYPWGKPHILTESDLRHVLYGEEDDPTSGGHLHGVNRKEKTPFPEGWTPEDIRRVLIDVAGNPHDVSDSEDGVWNAKKLVNGVWVVAVVHEDARISAGWPKPLPVIDHNQRGKGVKRRERRRSH